MARASFNGSLPISQATARSEYATLRRWVELLLLLVTWPALQARAEPTLTSADRVEAAGATPMATPVQASSRREVLIASVTIFVLAVFVGFEVITKVPPTLHTPLMSGSNAISGITLVGALIVAGTGRANSLATWLGALAVAMATVNVVGGFMVTHRMLAMFRSK